MDILRTTTTKYPDDNSVIPVMEAVLEVVQTEKSCNENLRRIGLDLQTIAIDWFNKGTRQGGLIVKFKVSQESRNTTVNVLSFNKERGNVYWKKSQSDLRLPVLEL